MPRNQTPSQPRHAPKKGKKYFTLDQANKALPYLQRVLADLTAVVAIARQAKTELDAARGRGTDEPQRRLDKAAARYEELLEELRPTGVELKDPGVGLIDFPCVFEGREILLCWKLGEPRVSAWHEIESGFSGRRPIETIESHVADEAQPGA